jgi:hypothetical protein
VNVVRAGAGAPAPLAAAVAARDPPGDAAFFAASFSAAFLVAAGGAAFLGAGADFLAAGADFLGAGAAFLAGADFLATPGTVFFGAVDTAFLAAGTGFFVGVATFFTTGAAFFFERAGRFVAVAATLAGGFLFPVRGGGFAVDRDAGNFLTWEPLLAGVIVPSFGPLVVAGFPDDDLVRGAGDDTGPRR